MRQQQCRDRYKSLGWHKPLACVVGATADRLQRHLGTTSSRAHAALHPIPAETICLESALLSQGHAPKRNLDPRRAVIYNEHCRLARLHQTHGPIRESFVWKRHWQPGVDLMTQLQLVRERDTKFASIGIPSYFDFGRFEEQLIPTVSKVRPEAPISLQFRFFQRTRFSASESHKRKTCFTSYYPSTRKLYSTLTLL